MLMVPENNTFLNTTEGYWSTSCKFPTQESRRDSSLKNKTNTTIHALKVQLIPILPLHSCLILKIQLQIFGLLKSMFRPFFLPEILATPFSTSPMWPTVASIALHEARHFMTVQLDNNPEVIHNSSTKCTSYGLHEFWQTSHAASHCITDGNV